MMLQLNATPFLSCRFGSWEIATQGRARGKREVWEEVSVPGWRFPHDLGGRELAIEKGLAQKPF